MRSALFSLYCIRPLDEEAARAAVILAATDIKTACKGALPQSAAKKFSKPWGGIIHQLWSLCDDSASTCDDLYGRFSRLCW